MILALDTASLHPACLTHDHLPTSVHTVTIFQHPASISCFIRVTCTACPCFVDIYGLLVPIFSIHCAITAIMTLNMPFGDGEPDDSAHAIVAMLAAWFRKLSRRLECVPKVITVLFIFNQSGMALLPELQDAVFVLGTSKGTDADTSLKNAWRKERHQLPRSVLEDENLRGERAPKISNKGLRGLMIIQQVPEDRKTLLARFARCKVSSNPIGTFSFGNCAETIPLAVLVNAGKTGVEYAVTIMTRIMLQIQQIYACVNRGKFKKNELAVGNFLPLFVYGVSFLTEWNRYLPICKKYLRLECCSFLTGVVRAESRPR
jgi:hypothetical protein